VDGLQWHNLHIGFCENRSIGSKVEREGTHGQHDNLVSQHFSSRSGLKITIENRPIFCHILHLMQYKVHYFVMLELMDFPLIISNPTRIYISRPHISLGPALVTVVCN
jgi:hypothetical protein